MMRLSGRMTHEIALLLGAGPLPTTTSAWAQTRWAEEAHHEFDELRCWLVATLYSTLVKGSIPQAGGAGVVWVTRGGGCRPSLAIMQ